MRVLLLHASLGAGHKRAADALWEVLLKRSIETEIHDLLEFLPPGLGRFYSSAYRFMINETRWLWRMVYETADMPGSPYSPAKSALQSWQFHSLKQYVRQKKFTHIFSTHFTPSALIADWKQESCLEAAIFSVITDYVTHRLWKRKGLDHYFVATEDVAEQIQAAGILPERITVSGIPISQDFSNPPSNFDARLKWSFQPEDRVLLVLCSGLNLHKTLRVLQEIGRHSGSLRFLVSTGPDPAKEQKVKEVFQNDSRFIIFGFSSQIAEMMAAADLIVSKPGGLIVTESLAMGLPMLLFPPIPGQEEANAEYAARHGAAICLAAPEGCIQRVLTDLLGSPEKLSAMARASSKLGRPQAASDIIDRALRI
jgi:processive 1,2-diacylglycerol beta-glucosyltransferase